MYPRLIINIDKLKQNLDACAKIIHKVPDCSLMIVTKGICADPEVVRLVSEHPDVTYVADSRIQNLKTYADDVRKKGKQTVLLRIPMHSEVEETIRYADVSLNSEITTIRHLNEEAHKNEIIHKVVLMIDLGDLREGIFIKNEKEIFDVVEEILSMENICLHGLGVNLTCYGAIIPKNDNLSLLTDLARKIEQKFYISIKMISGGNSSSIYLIGRGELPKGINNLRLGESFLLGNDTAYGTNLPGTVRDALVLQAEIVELKTKPSYPIGEIGVDAFGHKPEYMDTGMMTRAIIAIGRQDIELDSMIPEDHNIKILGGSSDHIILDLSRCKDRYQVGDKVSFTLGYGGMLKASTSSYVEKVYEYR